MRRLYPPEIPELPSDAVSHWDVHERGDKFTATLWVSTPRKVLVADTVEELVEKVRQHDKEAREHLQEVVEAIRKDAPQSETADKRA